MRPSPHGIIAFSQLYKERGEVQGNKDYLKNRKPMTRGIQCGRIQRVMGMT